MTGANQAGRTYPVGGEYLCKIASLAEMNEKWDDEIARHPGNSNWVVWKDKALNDAREGRTLPYYGILGKTIICEATAILHPVFPQGCAEAAKDCTVELGAFRTHPAYRGQGYFSKLMAFMLSDLRQKGYTHALVGVEPEETRNRDIYHHWGFTQHVHTGSETYPDGTVITVEFYQKQL